MTIGDVARKASINLNDLNAPRVGDKIMIAPVTFGQERTVYIDGKKKREEKKPFPGVVTYVHPWRRWYMVTFDKSNLRECFFY